MITSLENKESKVFIIARAKLGRRIMKKTVLNNKFLEQAVFAVADGYCNVNLSQNLIPGVMYYVKNGITYSLNELLGLPENSKLNEAVEAWSKTLPEEEQERFLKFFDREALLQRFYNGESHLTFTYWTQTVKHAPMLAENHLAMFQDEKTGDVLGVNYAIDRTEQYYLRQQSELLEEKNKQLKELLNKEQEYKKLLEKSVEETKRASIAKTDFLRRMSHDIRTPINGIRGMISIANHYPTDYEKQQHFRNKIMQASGFLLDLVNDILNMNKLESGMVRLEEKPFDVTEILQETVSIASMQANECGIKIERVAKHFVHEHLLGSPLHLRQILQNIAGNAVKYSNVGGVIKFDTKELSCENGKAEFLFICADNGRGMSEEFLQKAFEPFAQELQGARSSFNGTGLGLPITKQLIELMGGSIKLESKLGEGTTVYMKIPFNIDTNYKLAEKKQETVMPLSLKGVKVLLVEDNDLNMEIAKFFLERAGMKVTCAWNGQEAVDIFAASPEGEFAIILMDIMMPVLDGLDATRAIRGMQRMDAQSLPIFAMTANAFTEDVQQSKEAGMNEHISKPLNEAKLLELIQKYVDRKNCEA